MKTSHTVRLMYYTLDMKDPSKPPRVERDLERWAKWFETTDRTLKSSELLGSLIITSFAGVAEHASADPLLFETIIVDPGAVETALGRPLIDLFDSSPAVMGRDHGARWGNSTYRGALAWHAHVEAMLRAAQGMQEEISRVISEPVKPSSFLEGLEEIE